MKRNVWALAAAVWGFDAVYAFFTSGHDGMKAFMPAAMAFLCLSLELDHRTRKSR